MYIDTFLLAQATALYTYPQSHVKLVFLYPTR